MIPFNLLLWGYIGYTIYDYYHTDIGSLPMERSVNLSKKKQIDSSNYTLALNYADPFLKEEPRQRNNNNSKPTSTPNKPLQTIVSQKTVAEAPKTIDIKYMGLVENKTSGVATGLVSINGKSFLVKKGEKVEGVLIKTLNSDKLEVKVGKENLTIVK